MALSPCSDASGLGCSPCLFWFLPGYWAWDVSGGEPYIQGAKDYLYRAIDWARAAGIKIIVRGGTSTGSKQIAELRINATADRSSW
jgi:hypothetical protein